MLTLILLAYSAMGVTLLFLCRSPKKQSIVLFYATVVFCGFSTATALDAKVPTLTAIAGFCQPLIGLLVGNYLGHRRQRIHRASYSNW